MKKRFIVIVGVVLATGAAALEFHRAHRATDTAAPRRNASAGAHPLWHCGMHPQVVSDHPGDCPICHMALTPVTGSDAVASEPKKVLYWWDPMLGTSSISQAPGKSAMGMDLVPVYAKDVSAGPAIAIDPLVVQNMGIRTAVAVKGPLEVSVRALGVLMAPQPGLHDVSLRVSGWAERVYADTEGMHVHKGEVLFDLYSPELQLASEELISAASARKTLLPSASAGVRKDAENLFGSAKRKLELWDVADVDIDAIASAPRAPRTVPFRSPADGDVVDDTLVQGSAVQAGAKLMRIEDHLQLWLDAQVYEDQLSLASLGATVEATLDALPGKYFSGKVSFIHPHVEHMTRTATVRTTLENPDQQLKPGMWASVQINARPFADALLIPREAVIDTGTRKIVFVALPDGHFDPRLVRTGLNGSHGEIQILEGVMPGESVVTSGQFLMDVESRTLEAIEKLQKYSAGSMPTTTMSTGNGGGMR